jgi:hypothetical protein
MHAANIDDSPRLLKVRDFLRRVAAATTLEIIRACDVCAVNSIISELRINGYHITCTAVKGKRGVYAYKLIEADQLPLFGR